MDIVERLREDAEYHRFVSYDADCSPEATINHKHHVNALEAADEIERLREDLIEAEKYNGYHQQACLEIERLREALRNIADKTVCSYAKITATVALINWQEPAALQQKESE